MGMVHGFGLGIATHNTAGETLDVFYPNPLSNIGGDLAAVVQGVSGPLDENQLAELSSSFAAVGASEQAAIANQLNFQVAGCWQPHSLTMPPRRPLQMLI